MRYLLWCCNSLAFYFYFYLSNLPLRKRQIQRLSPNRVVLIHQQRQGNQCVGVWGKSLHLFALFSSQEPNLILTLLFFDSGRYGRSIECGYETALFWLLFYCFISFSTWSNLSIFDLVVFCYWIYIGIPLIYLLSYLGHYTHVRNHAWNIKTA